MINLFPPCYLRPSRIASDEGSDTDDEDDDDTDDDNDDDDDDDNDDDNNADADSPNAYLGKSQGLRKEFLSEFSDDEVAEMWQVHNFMMFVSRCARNPMPNAAMIHDCGLPTFIYLMLHPMDTEPPPDILLWSGPSTAAKVLRDLRSFDEPKIYLTEQANWDHHHFDGNWPGLPLYLQEKNYDVSKVGTNIWDPVQDKNVILDSRIEDTEECKCFRPGSIFDRGTETL
jgi:hypothetical protein